MNLKPAEAAKPTEIDLPGRHHPLLCILAFVPLLIAIFAIVLAVIERPPIMLLLVLVMVLASCSTMAFVASQHFFGTKLIADDAGLTIKRFGAQERFEWEQIAAAKVMPATGSLGDDPFCELAERIGVGLFLRDSKRDREHDLDADLILCAGDRSDTNQFMKIAEKLQSLRKRAMTPRRAEPVRRVKQANQRQQFRARPGSTELVSQFRNKQATAASES